MGWKVQIYCTPDHPQLRCWGWSGVLHCTCEHYQLTCAVPLWCIVKSNTSQVVAWACSHCSMTPSQVGTSRLSVLQCCMCVLAAQRLCFSKVEIGDVFPRPHKSSPHLSETWLHVGCIFCFFVFWAAINKRSSSVRWPDCMIQLQLSWFLIVGFKLTYAQA